MTRCIPPTHTQRTNTNLEEVNMCVQSPEDRGMQRACTCQVMSFVRHLDNSLMKERARVAVTLQVRQSETGRRGAASSSTRSLHCSPALDFSKGLNYRCVYLCGRRRPALSKLPQPQQSPNLFAHTPAGHFKNVSQLFIPQRNQVTHKYINRQAFDHPVIYK